MRPVDKGAAPTKIFKEYKDAESFLEERIGVYCSFCEFHIQHTPEVEHREAKSEGGDELAWENLLLSCKYCNTRKATKVKAGTKAQYLWPDEDDTFHAFCYDEDIPRLNMQYLSEQDESVIDRANALYELVKLDNIPCSPRDKDRRYMARSEARNMALESRYDWERIKDTECADAYFELMLKLAGETGFFSVWMNVFHDEPRVRDGLIRKFKGTRRDLCITPEGATG